MKNLINKTRGAAEKFLGLSFDYAWKNSRWVFINSAVNIFSSFFTSIAFANLISPALYGSYKYLNSVGGFLDFLKIKWIDSVAVQELAKDKGGAFFWAINQKIRWGLLFFAGLLLASGFYFLRGNYIFAGALLILAVTDVLINILGTYNVLLQSKRLFREDSLYSSSKTILRALLLIAVLFFAPKLIFIFLAINGVTLLANAYFYFKTVRQFFPEMYQQSSSIDTDTKHFSRHIYFLNIFATITNNIDSLLLFHFLGPETLAVYAIAKNFPNLIQTIIGDSSFIYFPKLAALGLEQIKQTFWKRLTQATAVGVLVSLVYINIIPFVFDIIYPKYPEATFYTQLIGLSFILFTPGRYFSYIFQTQKLITSIYVTALTSLTIRFTLYIVLGYVAGITGIIFAYLVSYFISLLACIVMWRKETG